MKVLLQLIGYYIFANLTDVELLLAERLNYATIRASNSS